MKSCPSCDRHVRASETSCPFCRAPLREVSAPLIAVLGLAGVLVGCSDDGTLPTGDGSGGAAVTTTTETPASDSGSQDSFTSTSNGAVDSSGGSFDTTTTDADTGVDDSADGAGFIYGGGPDSGAGANECDVIDNDCPDGEKCVPWANDGGETWNATRCVPVADGAAAAGEPCVMEGSPTSGVDDCDAGSTCLHVDPETLAGTCVSFCESAEPPTCAEEGLICAIANDGVLAVCLEPCDPKMPECPGDQECFPLAERGAVCF